MKTSKVIKLSEKSLCLIVFYLSLFTFFVYLIVGNTFIDKMEQLSNDEVFLNKLPNDNFHFNFLQVKRSFEKIDWHDWKFVEYEITRHGPGEQGEGVRLRTAKEIMQNRRIANFQGLSAIISDKISVNRSVPDTRHEKCKLIKYFKTLPSTSVIIIYHNEYLSLLLRTIHSIYNRTPHDLLHEIILVNDASTLSELYDPLEMYLRENFDDRVKITNLDERKGLIVARMEGARRATGEVLVFFDAHMEVNVNWLPPLLEPIVNDPRVSTVPINDNVNPDTFEYVSGGEGSRGVFDWSFYFFPLSRRPGDMIEPEKPAPTPIMLGCSFAIRRDYFFHLGGYDEKLIIWNGENYELSLKLWLCGGTLLEVPCSRVSHLFRKHYRWRISPDGEDFSFYTVKNFKRVAEVWLDDYKKNLYRNNELYEKVDVGDLTREMEIKKKLNCKPFQYMLDVVMPDMLERFPLEDRGAFARGSIQSEADRKLCIDTFFKPNNEQIGLNDCSRNLTEPKACQNFTLNWSRQIVESSRAADCLDSAFAGLYGCHFDFSNQFWFYDIRTHQLMNTPNNCLTAKPSSRTLKMKECLESDVNQKWTWGYLNSTALGNWKTFGIKLPKDIVESFKF